MDSKPNLARDWWEAVLALTATVFVVRAFFSLIAVLRPVPPTIEQDVIYVAVIVAGASIVAAMAARRFAFAEALRPQLNRLLYAAFGAGAMLALWMFGAFPAHVAAEKAYAADSACGVSTARNASSALCRTATGRAVGAWFDRNAQTYSLAILVGDRTENVELECPGVAIFTGTVASVRTVRVDYYGSRIAMVGVAGLACATTFAPSPARTFGILVNAIFGCAVASYAAWLLWGSRVRMWRRSRRKSVAANT